MFVYNDETRNFWFNRDSMETEHEFRLVSLFHLCSFIYYHRCSSCAPQAAVFLDLRLAQTDAVVIWQVGSILGLAIYNGVILDIHFPQVQKASYPYP